MPNEGDGMKITVIMLTYNRKEYLDKVISSVLKQSFRDFEYLIINNGSTDGSSELVRNYMKQDDRIRLIEIPKGTIAVGRAVGVENARGEYIAFIDDDDWLCEDMLEVLFRLAEEKKADISFCGSFKEADGEVCDNCIFDKKLDMTPEAAVVLLLKRKKCNAALPTKLIKKELFQQVVFPPESVHEDIFVTYKLFALANRVVAEGEPKYCFVRHGDNISAFTNDDTKLCPEQLEEYFTAFQERTIYLAEKLPDIADYAQYSEWSYLISMCNKIEKNHLHNCQQQLLYIRRELTEYYNEFYNSPYIEEFEKEFMKKYIAPHREEYMKKRYCDCLKEQIQYLKDSTKPIILFGAMAVGSRAKLAVESVQRRVSCYCDNDEKKHGAYRDGIEICSPEEAYARYGDADIFLCMLNPKNVKVVSEQLRKIGFSNIYENDVMQYLFQISYLKRNIETSSLAETMYYLHRAPNALTLGTIGVSTGTYCTLKCRDCIAQNPYMNKQEHYDKDMLIKGMHKLAEAVDAIEAFHIVGGEPFLYPWLADICEAASSIRNVERITVFTNGTIIPERKVLERLRNTVLSVRISYYSNLEYEIKSLLDLLDEYGIVYEVDEDTQWTKHPYPEYKKRKPEELEQIYEKCYWRTQPGIRDGKLRWCSFAESISPFFDFGEEKHDYVDVFENNKVCRQIRDEIVEYKKIKWLTACNYCDAFRMWPAERGVQLSE